MDIKKLQRVVVDALEDVKAQNIKVYNTIGLSDMFDRVVIASGTSNRQTRALAYRVAQQVKEAGGNVVSVEGADAGEWVLVDLGDLVVHVMQPAVRDYYGLEEIWGGKPVRMKTADSGARRIVEHVGQAEASAPAVESGETRAGGDGATPPAIRPTLAATQARAETAEPSAAPEKPHARSKTPARTRTASALVTRKTAAKKGARTAARKPAVGRSAVKKATKTPAARKTAKSAGKAAPRKAASKTAARRKTAAPRKTAAAARKKARRA